MKPRKAAIILGFVTVIAFAFFVPVIPMWILASSNPSLAIIVNSYGYGSITYYLFGLGGTYHSGTYGFTLGS